MAKKYLHYTPTVLLVGLLELHFAQSFPNVYTQSCRGSRQDLCQRTARPTHERPLISAMDGKVCAKSRGANAPPCSPLRTPMIQNNCNLIVPSLQSSEVHIEFVIRIYYDLYEYVFAFFPLNLSSLWELVIVSVVYIVIDISSMFGDLTAGC